MKKIVTISLVICALSACKKFDNTNPNVPVDVNPGVVLPQIFYNISNTLTWSAFDLNNELIQYTCQSNTITEVQRFKLEPSHSNTVWALYSRVRDIDNIIALSEKTEGLENYKAIAQITRAFIFSILTDTYGNIPYSRAGLALQQKVFDPAYDLQQDIYPDLIGKLEEAAAMIDESKGLPFSGDAIYKGNMLRWRKFANSLQLRLLMRISAKQETGAAAKITAMLSAPAAYPLIATNDDNALYRYSGSLPDVLPISLANLQDFTFKYKSVSAFIVDSLSKFNDSRLFQFARPTNASAGTANPQYVGLPNGLPIAESANYNGGQNFQSYLGTRFQVSTEPGIWMTAAEVAFLKAEAALKGYYTADAKQLYEDGIRASFQYWNAPFDESYLSQPGVSFDGRLPKVYLQKYFALFFCGMEAWAEYRRTGYPLLVPGPTNVNDGKIPSRLAYPLEEQSLNSIHYKEAINLIGGDDINGKMWWQP